MVESTLPLNLTSYYTGITLTNSDSYCVSYCNGTNTMNIVIFIAVAIVNGEADTTNNGGPASNGGVTVSTIAI